MMRFVLIPLLILLAACAPKPLMIGGARHETAIDGQTYTLYRQRNRAEVVRSGPPVADHREIRATMRAVVPWLSGCDLGAWRVDAASETLRGTLICPKGRR